jgi:hypothetical protein
MKKFVVRIDKSHGVYRLCIPHKLILLKKWNDVEYVLFEDGLPGQLIIRRFIDGKALEADD